MRSLALCATATAGMSLGGCAEAPKEPSYQQDVMPILAANCVRCHQVPAIGGAPDGFRLDTFEDTVLDDGRVIRGASAMADYIRQRVTAEFRVGDEVVANPTPMPPEYGEYGFAELDDRQIETLTNWGTNVDDTGRGRRGDPRADNHAPVMTIDLTGAPAGDVLTIPYEIRDPDFEVVVGTFAVTLGDETTTITRELHSGRGEIVWDIGTFIEGEYKLSATLEDGSGPVDVELDRFTVDHGGDIAPVVTIVRPRRDDILADADGLGVLVVNIDDRDTDPSLLSLTARARLGDQVVTIAEIDDGSLVSGDNTIDWDRAGLDESFNWQIEVEVSGGGGAPRAVDVEGVAISHQATAEDFASVGGLLGLHCFCHGGDNPLTPGVQLNVGQFASVNEFRGLILRRAIREQNMPPQSFLSLPGIVGPSAEERAQLREWLLAGSPEGAQQ